MDNDPEKYFDLSDEAYLYYCEHGQTAMSEYQQSYLHNKGNAEKLITLLLTGLSAIFIMLLKSVSDGKWGFVETGLLFLMLIWIVCSFGLLHFCIQTRDIPIKGLSPSDLYFDDPNNPKQKLPLDKLKRFRLYQLDVIIEELNKASNLVSSKLNLFRLIAATAPVGAGAAALLHFIILQYCF